MSVGLRLVSTRRLNRKLRGDGVTVAGVPDPARPRTGTLPHSGATGGPVVGVDPDRFASIEAASRDCVVVDPDCDSRRILSPGARRRRAQSARRPCPAWSPWDELDPGSQDVDAEMLAAHFQFRSALDPRRRTSSFCLRQSSG